MRKETALLSGIGIGAVLMYIFDPDRGRRRRALVKDKLRHLSNKASDELGKISRDLSNRAEGVVAETRAELSEDVVPDDTLVQRVKAALGHVGGHDRAIEVIARDGTIVLSGKALVEELPALIEAAQSVRGVKDLVNNLELYQDADGIPELQGTAFRKAAGTS